MSIWLMIVIKQIQCVFFLMRTKVFVHLTHLKLLKIFVWLKNLVKKHLEYHKIFFKGYFYNFTIRGVPVPIPLFKYKWAKQNITCSLNLYKIIWRFTINDITEIVNILSECPLKSKRKCFHIISQFTWYGNNGTHKVRVILKWFYFSHYWIIYDFVCFILFSFFFIN